MSGRKKWRARILYENHRDEGGTSFGLHELICAMVDDRLEIARFAEQHINGMPRNGVDKLLLDCRERVEKLFADLPIHARFGIVDADKLAPRIRLPANSAFPAIREELGRQYQQIRLITPDAPTVAQSNTEWLLRIAGQCIGLAESDPLLRDALNKNRTARDKVFVRLARTQSPARERFRQAQPALAELVDALAQLLRPALASE